MTKLIKNWEELSKVKPNDKFKIEVDLDMCCGWVKPVDDNEEIQFGVNYEYLSTHTFYGKTGTPHILKKYGFDIELDNWDKEVKQ